MVLLFMVAAMYVLGLLTGYKMARPQWKQDIKELINDALKSIINRVEKI